VYLHLAIDDPVPIAVLPETSEFSLKVRNIPEQGGRVCDGPVVRFLSARPMPLAE